MAGEAAERAARRGREVVAAAAEAGVVVLEETIRAETVVRLLRRVDDQGLRPAVEVEEAVDGQGAVTGN